MIPDPHQIEKSGLDPHTKLIGAETIVFRCSWKCFFFRNCSLRGWKWNSSHSLKLPTNNHLFLSLYQRISNSIKFSTISKQTITYNTAERVFMHSTSVFRFTSEYLPQKQLSFIPLPHHPSPISLSPPPPSPSPPPPNTIRERDIDSWKIWAGKMPAHLGDIQGCSVTEDIQGCSVTEDIQECSVTEDIQGCSVTGDILGCSVTEDIQGCSVTEDIQGCSVTGDI